MTTAYTNTPVAHTSDATFRTWAKEIHDSLIAVGCTQTADTGQINFATVTRPGVSTVGGYALYSINDSLSGSAPIIFKVEYGTGTSATYVSVWVTIGTGSNGSGTLTGSVGNRYQASPAASSSNTSTNRESYTCKVDGFVGCAAKVGYGNSSTSGISVFFAIARPVDSDGTIRSDGAVLYWWQATQNRLACEALNFATGATYGSTTNNAYCLIPNSVSNTAVGSTYAAFKHYTAYPQVKSINGLCTVLTNELGGGSQDSVALNGATTHTYVQLGFSNSAPYGINFASAQNAATHGLCMLWE